MGRAPGGSWDALGCFLITTGEASSTVEATAKFENIQSNSCDVASKRRKQRKLPWHRILDAPEMVITQPKSCDEGPATAEKEPDRKEDSYPDPVGQGC